MAANITVFVLVLQLAKRKVREGAAIEDGVIAMFGGAFGGIVAAHISVWAMMNILPPHLFAPRQTGSDQAALLPVLLFYAALGGTFIVCVAWGTIVLSRAASSVGPEQARV